MQIFDVDMYRQKLAVSNDLDTLFKTYQGGYPELPDISTARKWDNLLSKYEEVPEVRIKRLKKVVRQIDEQRGIFDIGVGWGDIVPTLRDKNINIDYTGIDFSLEVINTLAQKYPEQKFIHTTIDAVHDRFDYVLALEVMEHIVPSKIFDFLGHVKRVLKPEGILLITVPINENLKNNTFICGSCGKYVNKMGHVRSYSVELIRAELALAGFEAFHTEYIYDGYYGIVGSIKKAIRNVAGYLLGPSGFRPVEPCNVVLALRRSK